MSMEVERRFACQSVMSHDTLSLASWITPGSETPSVLSAVEIKEDSDRQSTTINY